VKATPRGIRRSVGIAKVRQRCTVHKHSNLLAHAPERLGVAAGFTKLLHRPGVTPYFVRGGSPHPPGLRRHDSPK
jgi:hypothetical protein